MESKTQKVLRILTCVFLELWTLTVLLDAVDTILTASELSIVFAVIRLAVVVLLQIYTIKVLKNSQRGRLALTIAMVVAIFVGGGFTSSAIYLYGLLAYLGLMIFEIMNKVTKFNLGLTKSIIATALLIVMPLIASFICYRSPDWIFLTGISFALFADAEVLAGLSLLRPLMTFLASGLYGAYAIVSAIKSRNVATQEVAVEEVKVEETAEEVNSTDAE